MRTWILTLILFLGWSGSALSERQPAVGLKLYVMDCGRLVFNDLEAFSDTGDYDGVAGSLMAPCFLIRHAKGDLLWEAGLGDRYSTSPGGVQLPNYRALVTRSLESQLRELGMGFAEVEFFAFSHAHADHVGNANQLASATWIVNAKELEWLASVPTPPRTNPALLSARPVDRTVLITGDHDIFGDGSVKILATPGHTPGHQSLLVSLPKRGAVLISGDLYHTPENRAGRRMPIFNVSRADTLASMERIEQIVRTRGARLLIHHSANAFDSLPYLPDFMD